jgi:hypothetical protein
MDNKMKKRMPARFGQLGGFVATVLFINLLCLPATGATPGRSLIFVIDSSERMAPYLEDIKGLIFTFADRAKRGDNMGIITFSEIPKRVALKKISTQRDRQSVEYWLNAIEAAGEHGDVAQAVARALEDVERLHRKGERRAKGIVVISSSQSPDSAQASEVLDSALDRLSKYVNRKEWYIQYCYLNGVRDKQVETFVLRNLGLSYDIDALQKKHDTGIIEELYGIASSPEKRCPVVLEDIKGIVLGKTPMDKEWLPLSVGAYLNEETELRVASHSRAIIDLREFGKIGFDSGANVALMGFRKGVLTGKGLFEITLEDGSIWMFFGKRHKSDLQLTTVDGVVSLSARVGSAQYEQQNRRLILSSFADPFSAKTVGKEEKIVDLAANEAIILEAGRMLEEVEPAEANMVEQWKFWSRALAKDVSLADLDFVVPEVIFLEEAITIGPVKSGDVEQRDFPMEISGIGDPSRLKMDVNISLALPDGLAISTGIVKGKEPNVKILQLTVDGSNGFKSGRSDTHPGLLNIVPAEGSQVMFEKVSVPLTIVTKGPIISVSLLLLGLGLILLGAIAFGAMFLFRSTASARPRPHSVIGRLIVVNDPTGGRVGTVNLEELGTKSSRLSLVIGRDRAADVRLKHASVSREHCTMEAHLLGGRLETFIEPVGGAKTEVNGETINSRTRLSDGARIKIGDFTYQFEDSQLYKKVEIMRRNGRRLSGILDVAGMDAEGFRLSPMDAVSPSERARIKFSDIRYAIFYRRAANILAGMPRQTKKTDTMKKIELMFRKGDTISGYVQREYVEGRRKYVELIPLDPDSELDYTVVDYSFVVEKRAL